MKEIVILSGKGGTGKTTLTASLAALWKNKVTADCDVDAADLHLILRPEIKQRTDFYGGKEAVIDLDKCTKCGQCQEVCVFDAIDSDFVVSEINCEGCGACYYFCPAEAISLIDRHSGEWYLSETRFGPLVHARLGIAEENSGKLVSLIKRQAKLLAEQHHLDTILVDGSPGIGCPVISSLAGADLVVVVTEPTISAKHDMERVFSLAKHFGLPAAAVVNKYDLNENLTEEVESLCRKEGVLLLGRISYDPVVTEAMVQGKTIVEYTDGIVAQEIRTILGNLQAAL